MQVTGAKCSKANVEGSKGFCEWSLSKEDLKPLPRSVLSSNGVSSSSSGVAIDDWPEPWSAWTDSHVVRSDPVSGFAATRVIGGDIHTSFSASSALETGMDLQRRTTSAG